MEATRQPLWTKRFILLCASNFLFFMSFFLLLPTLPVYLVENLGASEDQVGLIMGIFTIAAVFARPITGYLMDFKNQKALFLIAIIVFVVATFGYLVAQTVLFIFLIRFIYGFGFGMSTTAGGTMAAEWIPEERRGEGLGYYGTFIMVAMSVGPIVGVYVAAKTSYQGMFWFCFSLSLIGLLMASFLPNFKHEKSKKDARKLSLKTKEDMSFWFQELIEKKALPVSAAMMMIAIVFGGVISFVSLYAKELGDASIAGTYFTLYAIAIVISRPFAGKWFDQKGPNRLIAFGTLFYFIGMIILGLAMNSWMVYAAALVIGIGYGVLQPSYQALSIQLSPSHRRGAATATFFTLFDIGVGIGSFFLGWVVVQIGYGNMFLLSSLFLIVSYFVYFRSARPMVKDARLALQEK
ncbi:MFS transporter [Pseudalkalibacillus berkeleyi]|uniref:MFS transporter n=1 Tax=Pseudalkalibacillus berkeleyi TaxID=1069813 RepID=A0ABS9GUD9_9BACL|nr:MFS transporter [Pseudalkalibacillus berkeleyi]MCF6136299.1 MFS transporter [Pseudalkalibacillus berkeleyi]